MLSNSRAFDAAAYGCNEATEGPRTTKKSDESHMTSSGITQPRLGPRRVFIQIRGITTAAIGKTKVNPTKRLPIKYPRIGDPPGIAKALRT